MAALDYAATDTERAAIALIAGPGARLTGRYGAREQVPGTTSRAFHPGLDIAGAAVGAKVPMYAPRSFASVWYSSRDAKGALDLFLGTKEDGLRFVHNSSHEQTKGYITAGTQVATMGATGDVNGVHVHLERYERGVAVDPLPWLISLLNLKNTAPRTTGALMALSDAEQQEVLETVRALRRDNLYGDGKYSRSERTMQLAQETRDALLKPDKRGFRPIDIITSHVQSILRALTPKG